jgi:hypothetical protein
MGTKANQMEAHHEPWEDWVTQGGNLLPGLGSGHCFEPWGVRREELRVLQEEGPGCGD